MKKIYNYVLFLLCLVTFSIASVKADSCSYKQQTELNKEATNIKATYEFIDEDPLNYHFNVYFTNITENLKLVITDDYTQKEIEVTFNDTDNGVYKLETYTAKRKVTFNYQIYSLASECFNKKLLTKNIVTPRYNEYSTSYICEQVPDFKYCNEFADTSSLSYEKFIRLGEDYKKTHLKIESNEKQSFLDKAFNFFSKTKWYFIIGFAIIALAVAAFIVSKKIKIKKRGI